MSETENDISRLLCRMDTLSNALRAACRVAGRDELAFVRLHRVAKDELSISALGKDASFRAKIRVDYLQWDEERDTTVEISKHAAASLAGYTVKTPDGLDVEPLVSLTIGDEAIRVQDETGLFRTVGGRDEHRLADLVLTGSHERTFARAAEMPTGPFWIGPDEVAAINSVAKLMRQPIHLIQRIEIEDAVSRWYVRASSWEMTVSKDERSARQPNEGDDERALPEGVTDIRVVSARPGGGIA